MNDKHTFYKMDDGWFRYYINTETGEKKFLLGPGDTEVSHKQEDFQRVVPVRTLPSERWWN